MENRKRISETCIERLSARLPEIAQMYTNPDRRAGKGMYQCPFCGSGKSGRINSDGALHVTGPLWYCHSCGKGGNAFNFVGEAEGIDSFPDQVRRVAQLLGDQIDYEDEEEEKSVNSTQRKHLKQKEDNGSPTLEVRDVKKDQESADVQTQAASADPGTKYLHERGFTDETITHFNLQYAAESRRIYIPYPGTDYFVSRAIDPDAEKRYLYPAGRGKPLFKICEGSSGVYLITEGQLDAISLWQAGARNVIAMGSGGSRLLEKEKISGAVIVGDRDPEEKRNQKDGLTPGERNAKGIEGILSDRGIRYITVYPPEGYKDANDVLQAGTDQLHELISEWRKEYSRTARNKKTGSGCVNVGDYINGNSYEEDIDYFCKYKNRKTGFKNIDQYLTLYPGLACLTGTTSLGKTSFCVQLCDQLVEKGETVLYFSLEQLPVELVTKSIARRYYMAGGNNLTNVDIKNGAYDDTLIKTKNEYAQMSERFYYIKCDFTVTADRIVEYVESFIRKTGILPVVAVDYLQIISAPPDQRYDDRARIDDAVKKLKLLSKRNEIFVLMISNMARSSYRERIGEDSFKESGLIEFTCDYLFGLQLSVLEDDSFFTRSGIRGGEKETQKADRQNMIDEASQAIPKEVVLKSLKNRNGKKIWRAFFKYYPQYDYFEEDEHSRYEKKKSESGEKNKSEKNGEFKRVAATDIPFPD